MKYINYLGITLVPTGGKGSICGKPETIYTSVWFTNYLSKELKNVGGLVKMFGKPTKSMFWVHCLCIMAVIYSIFVKGSYVKEKN